MKLALNTNICPIISVGMYQTTLSPDAMFTDWQSSCAKSLSQTEIEYIEKASTDFFNINKYKETLSSYAMQAISDFFYDISGIVTIKLCKECEIYSPKYYNTETDELSFDIEIDDSDIIKISEAAVTDERFFAWAEPRYKSYDGFISLMPHRKDEFIKAIKGKDIERAVSMYLVFILDRDYIKHGNCVEYPNEYQYKLEQRFAYNHDISEFVDDARFHDIIGKV